MRPATEPPLGALSRDLLELRLRHFEAACTVDLTALPPQEREATATLIRKWAQMELAERKSVSVQNRIRSAQFLKIQTIDQFNFNRCPEIRKHRTGYLSLFDSIDYEDIPSAVFTGTAGLGKTHLARALGYRSCQLGLSVLFVTAAEMVNKLETAKRAAVLDSELKRYRRPQVLIVDELGYVTMDAAGSNLFYQVISARHDQGLGTITTTNLAFGKWNQIFANDAIAHSIVDRLTSEAEVFFMEGPSYRPIERELKRSRRKAKAKANS